MSDQKQKTCTCGTPSKANWYAEIVYGVTLGAPEDHKLYKAANAWTQDDLDRHFGTETDSEDGFYCDDHKPSPAMLKATGREHWTILESKTRRLR